MWYFKMVNWFSKVGDIRSLVVIYDDNIHCTGMANNKNNSETNTNSVRHRSRTRSASCSENLTFSSSNNIHLNLNRHNSTASPFSSNNCAANINVNNKEKLKPDFHVIRVSKRRMNVFILSTVFLLGVLSALFFIKSDINPRKQVFKPLPEEMGITDEHLGGDDNFFDIGSGLGIRIDPDGECDGDNPLGFELEAISAIHVALEMKDLGKLSKAQKLFQHAMALCPRHPDVLTNYGEFFETSRQDYLMADQLYVQALTYSKGSHTKALTNRKRTLPLVEELDERRLERIDEKRDILIQMPESHNALRRVKKEAYFQHLYHTAGIEGNTMTLSETRMILETKLAVGGKSILEHNEILGLDAAMKFINSTLVHRIGAITVQDILDIHKHLMGFVDPHEAGSFRQTQVYVGSHIPPRPESIPENVRQLIQWLNSEEALTLHPIHYAAIAHYKLVFIHPFTDGNGRTSRLLMNWVLMQAGYPPVIIRKQDRQLYYDVIDTANKGDIRPFIRFIADATERTVDLYLWATRELGQIQMLGSAHDEDQPVEDESKTIRNGKDSNV